MEMPKLVCLAPCQPTIAISSCSFPVLPRNEQHLSAYHKKAENYRPKANRMSQGVVWLILGQVDEGRDKSRRIRERDQESEACGANEVWCQVVRKPALFAPTLAGTIYKPTKSRNLTTINAELGKIPRATKKVPAYRTALFFVASSMMYPAVAIKQQTAMKGPRALTWSDIRVTNKTEKKAARLGGTVNNCA
jgi:hypothetical protein